MVNKCSFFGCTKVYVRVNQTDTEEEFHGFHFPIKKRPELAAEWERFVNRQDWNATEHSVLCYTHFEDKYITRGENKWSLKWKMNPVPTIYPENLLEKPSVLPTPRPPK